MSAAIEAMDMLATVARREGWREGYRAGRDAALRSLGPEGARALVAAVMRERVAWQDVMRRADMHTCVGLLRDCDLITEREDWPACQSVPA